MAKNSFNFKLICNKISLLLWIHARIHRYHNLNVKTKTKGNMNLSKHIWWICVCWSIEIGRRKLVSTSFQQKKKTNYIDCNSQFMLYIRHTWVLYSQALLKSCSQSSSSPHLPCPLFVFPLFAICLHAIHLTFHTVVRQMHSAPAPSIRLCMFFRCSFSTT